MIWVGLWTSVYVVNLTSLFSHDWVEVRDGSGSDATLVGKFCGSVLPESITSTGNSLYVRFVSDIWRAEPGFRAVITKGRFINRLIPFSWLLVIVIHKKIKDKTQFLFYAPSVGAATTVSPITIIPTEGPDVTTQEPGMFYCPEKVLKMSKIISILAIPSLK